MQIPESLERLIQELSKFPSIGRKTALRLVFGILQYSEAEVKNLADAILDVKQRIRHCSICFSFTESDPCLICRDESRNRQIICVVEQPNNVFPHRKKRCLSWFVSCSDGDHFSIGWHRTGATQNFGIENSIAGRRSAGS